jgi:hypothetical protein
MAAETFTIIDAGRAVETPVLVADGAVRLSPEALTAALGWVLEPEGLCRDYVCVPLPDDPSLITSDGIDLAGLAGLLDLPLALDLDERAAFLGASAGERSAALAGFEAPDFALPDLDGRLHSLAEHRGKKVLLVAYASW